MAEQNTSKEDKRLPASEQKLRKARSEGQVPRSRDLGHALLLSTTMGSLVIFIAPISGASLQMVGDGLRFDAASAFSTEILAVRLAEIGSAGFNLVWPIALIGMLASVLASLIPGGLVLSVKPLAPKLNRISPLAGLKRIFSKNHLIDSVKLSSLILLLALIAASTVTAKFEQFLHMIRQSTSMAMLSAWSVVALGTLALLLLLLLVALIDVPLQFFRNRSELKMTFQEVKQEHKEYDGDPHLRARLRARQREIGTARMMSAVPTADIVISNPTHYSVALQYDGAGDGAPVVVASGVDHVALRIREVARGAGVPAIEAPALARALWAHVPVGSEIPTALYNAVAQVLAYLYRLRQAERGAGQWPDEPIGLPVPPELDPGPDAGAADPDEQPGGGER